jgi:hypothetical protein
MQRTNRHLLRLWFVLVLVMAVCGWWVMERSWQLFAADLMLPSTGDTDWVAIIANLAEDAIKFFQGASTTSP